MTDKNTLDLAREWAEEIAESRQVTIRADALAAAEVITALPEMIVDGDELRKYIADWRDGLTTAPRGNYEGEILDDLESLLPTPPAPRTMAEIEWDDAEHHLAEALFGDTRKVVMLARDTDEEGDWSEWINCRMEDGSTDLIEKAYLTPTGRKYRLEPEDDTRTGTESENVSHGQPEPQLGEAWLIDIDGEQAVALLGKVDPADDEPTWFTDDGGGYSCDWGNPVARLVPETTKQDTETVFDPTYTYRDKDGDTWEFLNHNWRCSDGCDATNYLTPPAKYGPYTRIEA